MPFYGPLHKPRFVSNLKGKNLLTQLTYRLRHTQSVYYYKKRLFSLKCYEVATTDIPISFSSLARGFKLRHSGFTMGPKQPGITFQIFSLSAYCLFFKIEQHEIEKGKKKRSKFHMHRYYRATLK